MDTVNLPRFTMCEHACDYFTTLTNVKRIAVFYGEKAWMAGHRQVLSGIEKANLEIVECSCYGKKATDENVEKLMQKLTGQQVDAIFGVGGGNCLDTVKVVGDLLDIPVYTIATIASTCAAITKISIMYQENGEFKYIKTLKNPPDHCFIDPSIILEAPVKYLWAGIGDTMAKHVESSFSAKNDVLDYASELGIKIGENCFYPMLRDGVKAMDDARNKVISEQLKRTILNIIITTGSVSLCVDPAYNSALSHALFYGLTIRKHIEEEHLHGEVVSYGTLVQLLLDKQYDLLEKAYKFHKQLGLPVCLRDLGLSIEDNLEDILSATVVNKELEHVPYVITKDMILQAMKSLEQYTLEER